MLVNVNINKEDIVMSFDCNSDAFDLIKYIDEEMCDWDFTCKCLVHFINIFKDGINMEEVNEILNQAENYNKFKLSFK